MSHITDLPDMLSEIFLRGGLDTDLPDRAILQGVGGLKEFISSAGRNGTRHGRQLVGWVERRVRRS